MWRALALRVAEDRGGRTLFLDPALVEDTDPARDVARKTHLVDKQNGGVSHYLVDVAMEGGLILATGEAVTFIPGMQASVGVLSGMRAVFKYWWHPGARVQEPTQRG